MREEEKKKLFVVATPHGSDKNATETSLCPDILVRVATPHGSDKSATKFCKQSGEIVFNMVATPHGSDKSATLKEV